MTSSASSSKPKYLPECWDNDIEMSGLMSFLKARHTNPTHYDRVMDFWKKLIMEYCRHENTCLFSLDELKAKFRRGTQVPSPLAAVISESAKCGIVSTREDVERKNLGWIQWGITFLSPTYWINFNGTSSLANYNQFVHIPILKEKAHELLEFYRKKYNMMVDECPEVIAFDDLRIETSKFITRESFELVVGELVKMGEVSIGYSRDGERVLKFKEYTDTGPAKFTETDANVHEIRRTMNRLDLDIKKAEQKEQTLKDEARAAMLKKDKKTALQIMRKVALIRKSLADKDVQYQKLLGILEQLAQTKQTKEIIEGYKACSKAFKETLARQGLTSENVDVTVDNIKELMDDYNDIEEAMRCGINSLSDTTDDAELESELNELIEQDKSESARNDLKLPEVLANSNTVRVGKRVLDFDLPAVPSSGPSTSREASPNKPEFSLEERWKRLRMEAS